MAKLQYGDQNGRSKRETSTGNKRLQGLLLRPEGDRPDWARIDGELFRLVIAAATTDDGAIMFGYSRDGGAYSIKVYAGGEPVSKYVHSDRECMEYLGYILEVMQHATD